MTIMPEIPTRHSRDLTVLVGKHFLITGANGMLGRAFREVIESTVPTAIITSAGKDALDVRDRESVLSLAKSSPDFIIHCAAMVNADYCEDHEEEARAIKIDGIKNIIELAKITNAKVLYPQSFLIYDGKELPITETTMPAPLSVYGMLKLEAESILRNELPASLSIRMAGFFGGREIDKNFIGKICIQFVKLIREGKTLIEIGNRIWQPTFTNDLAYNCLGLLAETKEGIYCMSSHGQASFYEVAEHIVNRLSLGDRITIQPASAAKISAQERARRPEMAIIQNKRLSEDGLDWQRPWKESLSDYLDHPYFTDLYS